MSDTLRDEAQALNGGLRALLLNAPNVPNGNLLGPANHLLVRAKEELPEHGQIQSLIQYEQPPTPSEVYLLAQLVLRALPQQVRGEDGHYSWLESRI